MTGEQQYLSLAQRVLDEGVWVENERTGKKCLTIINADLEYDVGNKQFPILTTKKTFWKAAVAEMVGYLRGYSNASQFSEIGCNTWHSNANKTQAWLDNPHRKGDGDIGRSYGVVAKDFGGVDLIHKVYNNLKNGIDDRGEVITFWKPDDFDKACLRPCMYEHHFSLLNGVLNLHSKQRSVDLPLGLPFNMIQCYFLLDIMAKITGNKAGKVYHKLVNIHIYEDQVALLKGQLTRVPYKNTTKFLLPIYHDTNFVCDLKWLEEDFTVDSCTLIGYDKHHEVIKFPFSE